MADLLTLHAHMKALPVGIIARLACFCLSHKSTLAAIATLPMPTCTLDAIAGIIGVQHNILARWLMHNSIGVQIVAHEIGNYKHYWEMQNAISSLCEPSTGDPLSVKLQDALPARRVPSFFSARMVEVNCPSLMLIHAFSQLETFPASEFFRDPAMKTLVVNILRRWEKSNVALYVASVACRFHANIEFDPCATCATILNNHHNNEAVEHALRMFHIFGSRSEPGISEKIQISILWSNGKYARAAALGLFSPATLGAVIQEPDRFVREASRLKISSVEQMEQLLDDHATWCAIQESELVAGSGAEATQIAADIEQHSIQRAYNDAVARKTVASCGVCSGNRRWADAPSHVCTNCTPLLRKCRRCRIVTRSAICCHTAAPGQSVPTPLCSMCRVDRDSAATVFVASMQWPLDDNATATVSCGVCTRSMQIRANLFCATDSTSAPLSSALEYDIDVDAFGAIVHTACVARCDKCTAHINIANSTIIGGLPHCATCWMTCPGCRGPVLCEAARRAPSSRKAPANRCYHLQDRSPPPSDDEDNDNTFPESMEQQDDLHLYL